VGFFKKNIFKILVIENYFNFEFLAISFWKKDDFWTECYVVDN